jgi:uncharacterized protein with FMN-binding domain
MGLLLLYPTSTGGGTGRRAATATGPAPAGVVTPAAAPTSPAIAVPGGAATTPAPGSITVNGRAVDTDYGPVQVQITLQGKRIVRATAVAYPQDTGRDREINSYAIPRLDKEALAAQSAQIDAVSGASYTSGGYRQSLQSALDAAHLG